MIFYKLTNYPHVGALVDGVEVGRVCRHFAAVPPAEAARRAPQHHLLSPRPGHLRNERTHFKEAIPNLQLISRSETYGWWEQKPYAYFIVPIYLRIPKIINDSKLNTATGACIPYFGSGRLLLFCAGR